MKTITRVYDGYDRARCAVAELEEEGVRPSDINLIASKYVCEETEHLDGAAATAPSAGVGAALGGTAGLLAGLGIIAIPGLGPVVAAGALAATAFGAAAGAVGGGVIGALVSAGVPEPEAHVYCEAVRRGGTMVSARVRDEDVPHLVEVMDRHQPIDPSARYTDYRRQGWTKFDPAAEPYVPSKEDLDRMREPYRGQKPLG
jgi:hypothetical protein